MPSSGLTTINTSSPLPLPFHNHPSFLNSLLTQPTNQSLSVSFSRFLSIKTNQREKPKDLKNNYKLSLVSSVFLKNKIKMSIFICQAQDKIVTKNERNESFNQKGDMGGLSFLLSMSDITGIVRNREDKAYVHPNEKRSVSKLNEKSLEMCTESLGAETGSESGDELSLLAFEAIATPRVHSPPPQPTPQEEEQDTDFPAKKSTMSRNKSFPPPIKFVKGSKYNRMVRSLGVDGRLVVQAIRVSSPPRYFVADRDEGRLRLCLSPESSLLRQNHEEEEEEEEGIKEENTENLEGKNGNKKFSRLSSRCKENGREPKPMLTWKQQQFWVTT